MTAPLQLDDHEMSVLLSLAGPIDQQRRPQFLQEIAQAIEAKRQAGELGEGSVPIAWRAILSGNPGSAPAAKLGTRAPGRGAEPRSRRSRSGSTNARPTRRFISRLGAIGRSRPMPGSPGPGRTFPAHSRCR